MSVQQAILVEGPGVARLASDAPIPKLRDEYMLVQVKAVALNPTDWKSISAGSAKGAISGCDYAGIVKEVGKNVTGFQKGDRVAGLVAGANQSNLEDGAFAQYIMAKAALSTKIPDSLAFEQAATLGVGITTVGQGLYQSLGLSLPTDPVKEKTPLLIYGGSTATGSLAIQFAKLSGYEVITTASPRNHDFLRSLGADHVIDYGNTEAGASIRKLTNDNLKYAFDCIGEHGSPELCGEALSTKGGTYSSILFSKCPRDDVVSKFTLAYTATGEAFFRRKQFDANPEDLKFAGMFWTLTGQLLADGKLKTHPSKVIDGGLGTILESLRNLKEGKASGFKFVHLVE